MTVPTSDVGKVLLVRLSAVGDIIHGLPVARALKKHFPRLHLAWLVEQRFSCLLKQVKEIDEIIEIPRNRWREERRWTVRFREARELRQQIVRSGFEIAIDLQGLTKSAIWPWLARVPVRIGFGDSDGRELSRVLNNTSVIPDSRAVHVVDRNMSLLHGLGVFEEQVDLHLPTDPVAAKKVHSEIVSRGWEDEHLAFLQPGAGWETKRWPPEYYGRLGDFLTDRGYQVVVLWGPSEKPLAEEVLQSMKAGGELAPPTNLPELIELLRWGGLFVGGDTGPMHMAAALKIPVAAIFGASDPLRNGPYGQEHLVLASEDVCRPCWKTRCESVRCLRSLMPEDVAEEMNNWLNGLSSDSSGFREVKR